jgi:hypothetical protein
MKKANSKGLIWLFIVVSGFILFPISTLASNETNSSSTAKFSVKANTSSVKIEKIKIKTDQKNSTTTPIILTTTTTKQPPVEKITINTSTVTSTSINLSITTTTTKKASTTTKAIIVTSTTPIVLQTTNTTTATTTLPTVTLNLRYKDKFIFNNTVELVSSTEITYHDSATSTISTTSTNNQNVLTALLTADTSSNEFSVTDLIHYNSFNSYLVNCINVGTSTPACYNWQYVVDGKYPSIGMDSYKLNGGEKIYVYFGTPWRITASTSTFPQNVSTTLKTERYNYNSLDSEWIDDANHLIDISQDNPNPTGWWDTTITVATTTSDNNGKVDYLFNSTGTYYAKITSADWSKWSNPITLTILESVSSTNSTSTDKQDAGGGNGGSGGNSNETQINNNINVIKAIEFLSNKENNGIVDSSSLYTDWAAIAFGAYNPNHPTAVNIKNYLLTDPNPLVGLNKVSDYSRRAMALMSLNISPYSGTKTNYIEKIIAEFDGEQFGNKGLFNDDIFALFPLLNAGYNSSDEIITKTVDFILSKQSNGGWIDIDMTAATIQSLSAVGSIDGVTEALIKAKNKLKEAQKNNGGISGNYEDLVTTAWSMQAISTLGENQINWINNNKTPGDYLFTQQSSIDGGMKENGDNYRTWFTSYAIPAGLNKDWHSILNDFTKQSNNAENDVDSQSLGGSSSINLDSSTTTTDSTTSTPTSTPYGVGGNADDTTTSSTLSDIEITTGSVDTTEPEKNKTDKNNNLEKKIKPITIKPQEIKLAKTITEKQEIKEQILSSTKSNKNKSSVEQIIEDLPLDTPTKNTAKKALAISGGGALLVGGYLGLKLLKNMI